MGLLILAVEIEMDSMRLFFLVCPAIDVLLIKNIKHTIKHFFIIENPGHCYWKNSLYDLYKKKANVNKTHQSSVRVSRK